MTHTEISQQAGQRLEELVSMYTNDAVKSCLLDRGTSLDLKSRISEIAQSANEFTYFAEATVAKRLDPVKSAEKYLNKGFKIGGHLIDLNTAPNWEDFRNKSRNLRYKIHAWGMLDILLVADEVSEEDVFLDLAADIAHDWIKKYIIGKESDEFSWYDMAIGQRATKLSYLLARLIQKKDSFERIFDFIIASEIHIIELSQIDRIALHSNHGLFQISGLLSLTNTLPWLSSSERGREIAMVCMGKMFDEHFTLDGLHKEHSPEYHIFMVNYLSALIQTGWLEEIPQIKQLALNVEEAANWMQNPNNDIISMGDSKNELPMNERWHAAKSTIPSGLKFFDKGGMVIHNSKLQNWFQLAYSCQFHSRQHKHADDQNFVYFSNGKELIVDAGTFTYQYDLPERIYCESTRAHNTVEIDGYNFSRFRKDSFGSGIDFAVELGPCMITSGTVVHRRLVSSFIPNNKVSGSDAIDTNITHRRTLIHYPGRFLAVIDDLFSDEEHEYVQWNHFAPGYEIRQYTPTKFGIHDSTENPVARVLFSIVDDKKMKPIVCKGQTQPHLQGWYSSEGVSLVENSALGFSVYGSNTSFVTLIDTKIGRTGEPYLRVGSETKYKRFAITQDGSKVDIKFRYDSQNDLNIEALIDGEEYSHQQNTNNGE